MSVNRLIDAAQTYADAVRALKDGEVFASARYNEVERALHWAAWQAFGQPAADDHHARPLVTRRQWEPSASTEGDVCS